MKVAVWRGGKEFSIEQTVTPSIEENEVLV